MTSADYRISVEPQASGGDVATVEAAMLAFNVAKIGPPNESPVRIFLRDARGHVVGGLLGHIRWRWLYVAKLWVNDSLRGQGHGARLMKAAEEHARSLGSIGACVDTFEYQARPFYEKLGYELFGTLEDYPPGYRQFHLVKRLASRSEKKQ